MAGSEKRAGGEILGRLAGLATRPFVGGARSQGVQQAVTGGITRHVNQPIERGLRAGGVHKAISKVYEHGMRPIPGTPKLVQPVLHTQPQRAAYGQWRADDIVKTVSENPELLAGGFVPMPGTTEAILGGKHLLRKALGVKVANGDMLQYFADHPEKLKEKQERDRRKKEKRAEVEYYDDNPDNDPAEYAFWKFDEGRAGRGEYEGRPQEERDIFKKLYRQAMDPTFSFNKTAEVLPYQQKTQWSCSASCLKAVVAHHGVRISEMAAIQLVGAIPGRGAETDQIAAAARKLGFLSFEYSFDSIDQARHLLDQGLPIICDIQSFNNPGKGHYVVMTSADDARVQLMDPNTPGNWRVISRSDMNARWWDRAMAPPHNFMWRWGIVVVPPEE